MSLQPTALGLERNDLLLADTDSSTRLRLERPDTPKRQAPTAGGTASATSTEATSVPLVLVEFCDEVKRDKSRCDSKLGEVPKIELQGN